jgi:hypothetical protein
MDLFFQLSFPILGAGSGKMPSLYMPSVIKEVDISSLLPNKPGEQLQIVAHDQPDLTYPVPVEFDIDAWHSAYSEPVAKITGLKMSSVNGDLEDSQSPRPLCYKVQWEPLDREPQSKKEDVVVVTVKGDSQPANEDHVVALNDVNGHTHFSIEK